MARHTIKVPSAGESIETVTILEWHVDSGGEVAQGDDLVTVEAEKVDIVIPSPVDGTLVEILARPDNEVSVGSPLCIIESPA
jgi:pyruvate/2-oxoglutarate dehydrogenase complex dihydrolipoamide acyltransferase (E2) component